MEINNELLVKQIEDKRKLERYNQHIKKLEKLLKSVELTGEYEAYRLAPCFLLFYFIDLLRSVAVLDQNHMVSAGNIICRTMFEVLVDFLYCETDRNNLYLRFGSYTDVNRVLMYNSISEEMKTKVNQNIYKDNVLPKYQAFLKKYNIKDNRKLNNWSGLYISQRVSKVSKDIPEILNLYYNIYKLNCDYTHTYATTISEYAIMVNKGIELNYEQKYNKDRYSLIKQINSLVDIFYEKFNISYANKQLKDIEF